MIILRFCCGPIVKNQDTITAHPYMAGLTKLIFLLLFCAVVQQDDL